MTISAWASILKIALRLAKSAFLAEVRRGAKEIADRERKEGKDIDGDGGIGSIGGKIAMLLIALSLLLSNGCATLRPDGSPTWWGKIVIWVYPTVDAEDGQ
jgi:hypothetical protein